VRARASRRWRRRRLHSTHHHTTQHHYYYNSTTATDDHYTPRVRVGRCCRAVFARRPCFLCVRFYNLFFPAAGLFRSIFSRDVFVTVVFFFITFTHPFTPSNQRLVGRSAAASERNNVRVSRTPKTDVATVSARTVDRNSHYRQSPTPPPPTPYDGSLGNLFQRYLIFFVFVFYRRPRSQLFPSSMHVARRITRESARKWVIFYVCGPIA